MVGGHSQEAIWSGLNVGLSCRKR